MNGLELKSSLCKKYFPGWNEVGAILTSLYSMFILLMFSIISLLAREQ